MTHRTISEHSTSQHILFTVIWRWVESVNTESTMGSSNYL